SELAYVPWDGHCDGVRAHNLETVQHVGASDPKRNRLTCWNYDGVWAEGGHRRSHTYNHAAIWVDGHLRIAASRAIVTGHRSHCPYVAGRMNCIIRGSQNNGAEKKYEQPNCRAHPNLLVELNLHAFTNRASRMRSTALKKQEQI